MKKLLLIGNGPIENDITEKVNEFDYVVRINRMTNKDKTGDRADACYVILCKQFFDANPEPFDSVDTLYIRPCDVLSYLAGKKRFFQNVKNIKFMPRLDDRFSTTIGVLKHLLETDYEIWLAGVTIDGRSKLDDKLHPMQEEEYYLKGLLQENKIKLL